MIIIGKLTDFKISADPPPPPVHTIGAGRAYYLRGKHQSSWSLVRSKLPDNT